MPSCTSRLQRRDFPALILLLFATLWLACMLLSGTAQAQTSTDGGTPADTPPEQQTDSYAVLADLLENNETRDQLVEQLRKLAEQPDGTSTLADTPKGVTGLLTAQHAPGTGIATRMQFFAEQLKDDLEGSWLVVSELASGQSVPGVSVQRWLPALYNLLLAIGAVIIAYAITRLIANVGFNRINQWIKSEKTHPKPGEQNRRRNSLRQLTAYTKGRKLLGVLGALIIDVAASLLAAMAAYAALIAFTRAGATVSLFSMQFLTAFVMIEAIKAVSRGFFATRFEHLRLIPVSSDAAQYWNRWLAVIITITGYSLLVVVPVVQTLLTPAVGDLLGLVLMIAVYLYAVKVVWTRRHTVRNGLTHVAERSTTAIFGTLIRIFARVWHWLALSYLTVLFIVSQTRQQEALSFMGKATVQSLLAVLFGTIAIATVSTLVARRIHLPDHWNRMLPSLETRLNAYVPAILKGLRFLILILVTLIVLDAWQAFNLFAWLSSASGQAAVSTLIHIGIIMLIAVLSWTVLASIIEHRLGTSTGRNIPTEREKTLLMLFRNAAAITIATMTTLVVLSQIGIDIGPLIAGAGVAGLAIGFGAQKLVQDVITGVFIQLENGMNQNDIVELADLFGTVEKITIRSVVIRTLDGGYHLVPFSTIDKLTNHTRDYGYHYAEYSIAHRESVDDAIEQLQLAFKQLMQDPELAAEVLEEISIPGVTSLNQHGFTIRVMIKTTPGNQWLIQRAFNRLVKEHFDAAGIEVPYPQTVLHFGRDKDGNAPPLDIRHIAQVEAALDGTMTAAAGQTPRPLQANDDPDNAGQDASKAEPDPDLGETPGDNDPKSTHSDDRPDTDRPSR